MERTWLARLMVLVIAAALALAPARFVAMAAMPAPAHDATTLAAAQDAHDCDDCPGMAGDMTEVCLKQCAPPATLPLTVALAVPEPIHVRPAQPLPERFGQHPTPQEPPPKPSL